ncbi:Ig-like domain-containing protein [Planctomyces sp. SH-PL62]|uniref:Ig-like domain-containing protein n=1 Tax=Planctomyces sp. SH-PL62 TaxID=1636152 RepID=UPI00078BB4B8|nr:Ig-like domain-containing protein [Planctomyces sp. SH-PL62]AMV36468.1 hypothetical protein VT85_03485 [Planctomyces sp. SH-PL62]
MLWKAPFAVLKPRSRPSRRLAWDSLEDRTVPSTIADFASAFAVGGEGTITIREARAGILGGPWVVGSFTGTVDFDPGEGVVARTSAGGEDAFIASYDRMGRLRWARSFGGPGDDRINSLVFDDSGVVVAGVFSASVEFGPGYGETRLTSEGATDALLARFRAGDGSLEWARGFGGLGDDEALGLSPNSWGDLFFVVGSFSGTANFDPSLRLAGSTRTMTSAGGTDAFYVQLAQDGTWWPPLSSAARAGGPGNDAAVKAAGSSILGTFEGTADLSFGDGIGLRWISDGSRERTSAGGRDGFLVILWAVGYDPRRIQTFGGAGDDRPTDLGLVDNSTYTPYRPSFYYVSGAFEGRVDFGGAGDAGVRTSSGGADGFLARYDLETGALDWVATVGGAGDDAVEAIAFDIYLSVSATGGFAGAVDFDPGAGVRMLQDSGRGSAFLWRMDSSGEVEVARTLSGDGSARGLGVTSGIYGPYFVIGRFEGAVDVDPSESGTHVLTSIGRSDAFVVKFVEQPDMIPIAVDDMYRVEAGGKLVVWPPPGGDAGIGFHSNDILRVGAGRGTVYRLTNPAHGHIASGFEGQFEYEPDAGFTGTDSFTYQIRDGDLFSNVATVHFTVVEPGGVPATTPAVYLDRGDRGVWSWSLEDGFRQIHADDPEGIASAADGTLYLDLGPRGLWAWAAGAYRKLNDADPQGIAVGPGGALAVDYGAFGLWLREGGSFRRINAANPEGLAFAPDGALYIDFGPHGLWRWGRGAGVSRINGANPEGLAAGPGGVLYVDYGPHGLWDWREGTGFRRLNAADPEGFATTPAGTLAIDYGSFGLWRWSEATGLSRLDEGDALRITVGLQGTLFVDFGPRGLFRWVDGKLVRVEVR